MKSRVVLSCLALILTLSYPFATAHAQGTAFTYQGQLNDGVNQAGGNYDLRFALFDAAGGGAQQGNALTNAAIVISNGLFTVTLDFGDQFPGADRWLELGVRTNGGGTFTTLSPRQKLTSTPYALRAANATTANSASSVAAANITGTIPLAQLPPTVVTNGASGVNFTGTFSGNASGLSNLNSTKLTGALSISFGDPANIGHTNNGGWANGVAVAGNYAYLANYDDGLRVYDISNPANPVNLGHTDNGGFASGVAVAGNYAYLANGPDGLRVYDISNPANPVNLGHIDNGGAARGVTVSGNYAYLANRDDGLRVYDISNPANPVNIGHTNNGGVAGGVAVSGNYAYLANDSDGLRVYDISNPANPVNVGHIDNDVWSFGVAVSGNYAYLANEHDGLGVYDISNPANPVNIGNISNGGEASGVAVSGNYAYLANGNGGLRVYDISNPTNPVNIGNISNGGSAHGVVVSGNYAYLANGDDGLRVYALGVVRADSFRGDGSGLTGLNASQLTSGMIPLAQLPANVALRAGGNSFTGDQIVTDGALYLHGGVSVRSAFPDYAALAEFTDSTGSAFRSFVGMDGIGLTGDMNQMYVGTYSSHPFRLFTANQPRVTIDTAGRVGIGTINPAANLDVIGNVQATQFQGGGAGLTGLNAANLIGTIGTSQLPAVPINLLVPPTGKTLVVWGDNTFGHLNTPPTVLSGVIAAAAGTTHAIALKSDGSVVAWGGSNNYGQTTVPPAAQSGVTAIAAGEYHNLAVAAGSGVAWGANDYGECTVPLAAQSGVTNVAAGWGFSLALKNNGEVVAWGDNQAGQTNVPVAGQSGVVGISAGSWFCVALKTNGSVITWGSGGNGETNLPSSLQSGVIAISAGWYHGLALKTNGSVVAWGYNGSGQTNVPVAAQSGVVAVAADGNHSVALKNDGTIVEWGDLGGAPASVQGKASGIGAGPAVTMALVPPVSIVPLLGSPNTFVGNQIVTNGSFVGSGNGLSNLNASSLSSGTVADARLSSNVALRSGGNTFSGAQTFSGAVSVSSISSAAGNSQFNFNGSYGDVTMTLRQRAGDNTMLAVQDSLTFNRLLVTPAGVSVTGDVVASGTNTAAAFVGNGAGLTGLNASNFVSGTIADTRLSGNIALRNAANSFTGGSNIFTGKVGIGITNPAAPLQVQGAATWPGAPGAIIGIQTSGDAFSAGIYGKSQVPGAYGILGESHVLLSNVSGPGAANIGVGGNSSTTNGTGVYGNASAGSGLTFGVVGEAPSAQGYAGYFVGRGYFSGNVGIGITTPTNKLHVAGGVTATAFVSTSDRNAKENFTPVSPLEVLNKVTAIPITTWNFKDLKDGRHMGPMAQDFYAAFGLGGGNTTITSVDPDGVALAAIQGLNEKVEARSQKLETENAELKQRLERLERLMSEKLGGAK